MGRIGLTELILIVVALFLYFIPALIGRKHRNASSIFILNLLLGWTAIGWIAALVWAVSKDKKAIVIENTTSTISKTQELANLKDLLDNGTLTQEEFNEQKQIVLKS